MADSLLRNNVPKIQGRASRGFGLAAGKRGEEFKRLRAQRGSFEDRRPLN
jgi:hypothetical protein